MGLKTIYAALFILVRFLHVIDKLQAKNKQQALNDREHRWSVFVVVMMISLLLFSYCYEFYYWFNGQEIAVAHPAIVMIGALAFNLPLSAIGSLMLFSRSAKAILLIFCIFCIFWFDWFWVVVGGSWFAFIPMVPAFIILQMQLPKIRKKAATTDHSKLS